MNKVLFFVQGVFSYRKEKYFLYHVVFDNSNMPYKYLVKLLFDIKDSLLLFLLAFVLLLVLIFLENSLLGKEINHFE